MERKYEIFLGTGVLIAGIVILLFVFMQMLPIAQNPGKFVSDQTPDDQQSSTGPQCSFNWNRNGMGLTCTDTSSASSGSITSYQWDFGDGATDNRKNPSHTYSNSQDYTVQLTVSDQSGNSASAQATVHPSQSGSDSGSSEKSGGSGEGVSISMTPFAMALIFIGAYLILYLVGASILKAGWNLITPKAETISVRVKPKSLQVEPVEKPAQPQVVYVAQPQQQPPPPPPPQMGQQYPPGQP